MLINFLPQTGSFSLSQNCKTSKIKCLLKETHSWLRREVGNRLVLLILRNPERGLLEMDVTFFFSYIDLLVGCAHVLLPVCVVRGQLAGVGFLLLPLGPGNPAQVIGPGCNYKVILLAQRSSRLLFLTRCLLENL